MSSPSVIVTGTSSGLGLDAAVYLAGRGFSVYATMRDLSRREALDKAASDAGVTLSIRRMDVTDSAGVAEAVASIEAENGPVFGLVNNAGAQIRGYFEDLDDQEIRRLFDVNVFGGMRVTRAVLPGMRQAGTGRIVFVSSIGGRIGSPALSAYCATKFGVEGFSEILALELKALGIHVSSVAPAIIRTPIWQDNRGANDTASHPDSPYADRFRQGERLTDRMVSRAKLTPQDVSRTIHRALTATHPRVHYVVGRKAATLLVLRRLLPGETFERLYFGAINRMLGKRP